MYSRTEEERLSYIQRSRQLQIEAQEANNNEDEQSIKLPSSFIGSQAWASEQTADSMALGRAFGKPSFFCTMTFNPNWPEVQQRLLPGQSPSDIPNVCNRAFKYRLERVLKLLRTRFGNTLYLIKVIEFQKRGFPHAHIVFKVATSFISL